MLLSFIIFIFFLGAIIGSFLGVALDRYNTGKSMGGRSICFSCKRPLRPHELVPIISYVCLGGKCGRCKSKISIEYFFLEIVSGLMFVAVAFVLAPYYGHVSMIRFFAAAALFLTIFSLFLVIAFYDMRHKIIPQKMVWTAAALAFFGMYILRTPTIWDILAGPIIASPFALIWFLSKGKYMGLGDAKLALPIGWLLGLSSGAAALLFSFWSGAVISLLLMVFGKKKYKMKTEVPFAPYLVLGTFLVFAFSISMESIVRWLY